MELSTMWQLLVKCPLFCPQNVTLLQDADTMTCKSTGAAELDNAISVALTSATQKNGIKGKLIQNGMTGDPHTCPVQAMVRQLQCHKWEKQ